MNERFLEGKKVLLIALPGYPQGIVKQMQEMGAQVDYINDKPNDGFWCKTLGRLQVKFYQLVIARYYYRKIDELKEKRYDYVLVVRGEYTPVKALVRLHETFPDAKYVLYIWDGLHKRNTRGIEKKWRYFDSVYTFDRIDYEAHRGEIKFLPLYYYNEYLPKCGDYVIDSEYKYDVSFIGTGHSDRVKVVKSVMEQCEKKGLRTFRYIYIPHILVYWKNKLFNKGFKGVKKSEMQFKMLPFKSLYEIYSKSRCVVDVEDPGQHGLTMRSIEVVGLKRKLITTNKDIVNYDFYNTNNIFVLDRNNPVVDETFIDMPYKELDPEIYDKYSLKRWICSVLD